MHGRQPRREGAGITLKGPGLELLLPLRLHTLAAQAHTLETRDSKQSTGLEGTFQIPAVTSLLLVALFGVSHHVHSRLNFLILSLLSKVPQPGLLKIVYMSSLQFWVEWRGYNPGNGKGWQISQHSISKGEWVQCLYSSFI